MQIQANEPRRQQTIFRLEAGVARRCLSEEIEFTLICVLSAGQRPPLNLERRFLIQALPTRPLTHQRLSAPEFVPTLLKPVHLFRNRLPCCRSYEPHRSVRARERNKDSLSGPGSARHRSSFLPASRSVPAANLKTNAYCKVNGDRRRSCKPCHCLSIYPPASMRRLSSNRCPARRVCLVDCR